MENHQNNGQNGLKQAQVIVVVVPFPTQGHLNQLLHLSRLISAYDVPVHYVGTTAHNRQAKLRVHGLDPLSTANIHFHEFPTPSFTSPPPNPNAPIKFPSHLQPLFEASSLLREPVAKLLAHLLLTTKRIVVIHDSLMSSVIQDIASIPNGESYTFHSVSAFFIFWYYWEVMGKPFTVETELLKDLPSLQDCLTSEFMEFINNQRLHENFNSGNLYNSCKAIEGTYIDLLANDQILGTNIKQWAIGPFNPLATTTRDNKNPKKRHNCLNWLDKQAPNSVIYVSFGTTTSLTDEQIHELAIGLENSEQKFIWVLREADKGDIFVQNDERIIVLPKGYEERIEGNGIIVRDWAPQLEILAHSSTGGFMSHCGWNSCMESISMGVPIAAWPMHSDQPRNAMLITNVLKIGTNVKDWERRNELVTALMVEEGVRRLMGSKEGDEMRKKAGELGGVVQKSVGEGGITRMEMDSFIAHINRG